MDVLQRTQVQRLALGQHPGIHHHCLDRLVYLGVLDILTSQVEPVCGAHVVV